MASGSTSRSFVGRRKLPRGTDVALYHVGNNPDAHAWIVDALRGQPGVVVLHDFVLHHLVAGMTVGRRNGHAYLDAMEHEHGVVGRLLAHGVLDKRIPPLWESGPRTSRSRPSSSSTRRGSSSTRSTFSTSCTHGRVRRPDRRGPASRVAGAEHCIRARWRRPGDRLLRRREREQADTRAPPRDGSGAREHPEVTLLLVGPTSPGFDLERRLQRVGLTEAGLVREGWVDEARLWALMAGADIPVNLRHPTMGETSGSVIRALSLGKPLVVSDVGWFSELPDEVALKVPIDGEEVADPDRRPRTPRDATGTCGRPWAAAGVELARREHEVGPVAELYAAALEEAAGGPLSLTPCYARSARQRRTSGSRGRGRGEGDRPPPRRGRAGITPFGESRLGLARRHRRRLWFRAILGRGIVAPFIMVDEIIWSEVARGIADAGEPLLRDQPIRATASCTRS